jgi:hypothetical protein
MHRRDRRSRLLAAVVVALTATAACAKSDPAGVTVKGVDANLVFGVKEPAATAAPANSAGDLSEGFLTGDALLPPQTFAEPKKAPRVVRLPSAEPCPDAAANAFPQEAAPKTVPEDRRPAVGIYRWKKAGKANVSGLVEMPITGFEQRVVRNVRNIGKSVNSAGTPGSQAQPATIFAYDTVQPDASGNVVESQWQVDPWAQATTAYAPVGTTQVRQGVPERGIVLKGFDVKDRTGKTISSFHPTTGLLILPLPIVDGDQFQSVAVDPGSGQQASFSAAVLPRRDIDACGTIVQGWVVKGTQVFSGGAPRDYEAVFATQLGGLLLSEKIDQDDPTTKQSIHLTSTIGTVTPDPLPAG